MTPSFAFPIFPVASNASSWGPPDDIPLMVVEGSGGEEEKDTPTSTTGTAAPSSSSSPSSFSQFAALPYAPFGRSDRLGRVADFGNHHGGGGRYDYHQNYQQSRDNTNNKHRRDNMDTNNSNNNNNNKNNNDNEDNNEAAFQLVDTTKAVTTKRFVNPVSKRRQQSIRLRQINARRQQQSANPQQPGGGGGMGGLDKMTGRFGGGGRGFAGGRGGGGRGGRGGPGGGRGGYYTNRVDRQPSVAVQPDWLLREEIDLSKLTKNLSSATTSTTSNKKVPPIVGQDLLWCGFLDHYNEVFDKIVARAPLPLKRMEHKEFYPVTTTDDPVLEKFAVDGTVGGTAFQVFITDTILAHLMTCTRSVYPWDIVVQKLPNGVMFFDKRDNSTFDYLTVQETAYQPPADEEGANSPERLGLEATVINQNFSQQILKKVGRKTMDLPNPFFDEDDNPDKMEPASTAFRYRKFLLDDTLSVMCRTELHGLYKKTQYMTAFCLNEYTPIPSASSAAAGGQQHQQQQSAPTFPAQISWREKIDSQRGAVLATELKNNSFKLAKWTAQSILAGADQMKIGFASRTNPKSAAEHVILATQFYRPSDFAQQITLQESQMWSMFRMFVTLLQKQEEGKYVLMRNPNKPVMSLYKVPADTFEEEDE